MQLSFSEVDGTNHLRFINRVYLMLLILRSVPIRKQGLRFRSTVSVKNRMV